MKLSGKVLMSEIPREREAAALWMQMAMTMLRQDATLVDRPSASPSKIEWIERASIRMNGVMLGQQLSLALISASEAFTETLASAICPSKVKKNT